MDDFLLKRLREVTGGKLQFTNTHNVLRIEAADRIEALTAERDEAREWLGAANNEFGSCTWDWPDLWRRISKLKELSNERWKRAEAAEARVKELEGSLQEAHADSLLLSLKKLTFCLQEWDHFPETMPKAYDQQPKHVQMLMDLIQEHEDEKPYG